MRIGLFIAAAVLATGLMLNGCNAPSSGGAATPAPEAKQTQPQAKTDTKPTTPPKQQAKKPDAKKAEAPKKQPPAPPKKVVFGENILKNASFNERTGDALAAWMALETESNKALTTTKVDGGGAGLPMPEGAKTAYLKQPVENPQVAPGVHVRFGATVKAPAEDQLHVVLSYFVKGKEQKPRVVAKASNDWQELSKEIVLPKDADPKSLQLFFFRKPGATGEVLIKDAFVQIGK